MTDFDEIIRERIAKLPPETEDMLRTIIEASPPDVAVALQLERREQITEDVLRIIVEVLTSTPDVPLTGMARIFVAIQLERLLPKKEQAERERRRVLRSIEDGLVTAKWARKNPWSRDPKPALELVRQVIFRDPDDPHSEFPTIEALEQFLKRVRRDAKKKKKSQQIRS